MPWLLSPEVEKAAHVREVVAAIPFLTERCCINTVRLMMQNRAHQ